MRGRGRRVTRGSGGLVLSLSEGSITASSQGKSERSPRTTGGSGCFVVGFAPRCLDLLPGAPPGNEGHGKEVIEATVLVARSPQAGWSTVNEATDL